jgi:hypothetical protein
LQRRRATGCLFVRAQDHVIQWKTVIGALKLDAIYGRAGQTTWL